MADNTEFHLEIEFLSGPDDGEVVRLYSREATIGAEPGVDLVLASDTAASGRHARIQCEAQEIWIEDVQSERGTLVNGEKIIERRLVGRDDIICVGRTEFICRLPEMENAASGVASKKVETNFGS